MTGSWQAEAVLVTACLAAIGLLMRGPRRSDAGLIAAALAILAVAAMLGGLLFAGVAPNLATAHDALSRLFATLGFAVIAVVLVGGARWRRRQAVAAVMLLALAGLAVPLAPVVLLAHAIRCWRLRPRWRQVPALAAMAAVIAGQLAVPDGPARLDTLHATLALWAVALAAAV